MTGTTLLQERTWRAGVSPAWPLTVTFVLFPIWWVLGLGGFIWVLVAIPMLFHLLTRERVYVPRGTGLLAMFLLLMLASALMLRGAGGIVLFGYRASLYVAAAIFFVYIFTTPSRSLPSDRVVGSLVAFWAIVVVGGYLGILLPQLSFHTPAEAVLPSSVIGSDYLHGLVHARSAQVHEFLGYPVPRPAAPFVYTNEWGSAFALLVPIVVLWVRTRPAGMSWLTRALLAASIVPVVVSVNRGLWLSLILGLGYGAVRLALRGRPGGMTGIVVGFAVVAAIVLVSPLGRVVEDRLATGHSDAGRLTLYREALAATAASPVIGHAQPISIGRGPPVGTHGTLWTILVSHGIPAAILYVSWLVLAFWRTGGRGSEVQLWSHVVLFVAVTQLPYYGMLPYQIFVIFTAAALGWREVSERRSAPLRAGDG